MYSDGDFDDQNRAGCGTADNVSVVVPDPGNPGGTQTVTVDQQDDAKAYALVAQYKLGATVLRAGWNRCDPDSGDEADGYAFGFSHDLSPRTKVALEYQSFESATNPDNETDELAFHIRHSF